MTLTPTTRHCRYSQALCLLTPITAKYPVAVSRQRRRVLARGVERAFVDTWCGHLPPRSGDHHQGAVRVHFIAFKFFEMVRVYSLQAIPVTVSIVYWRCFCIFVVPV